MVFNGFHVYPVVLAQIDPNIKNTSPVGLVERFDFRRCYGLKLSNIHENKSHHKNTFVASYPRTSR